MDDDILGVEVVLVENGMDPAAATAPSVTPRVGDVLRPVSYAVLSHNAAPHDKGGSVLKLTGVAGRIQHWKSEALQTSIEPQAVRRGPTPGHEGAGLGDRLRGLEIGPVKESGLDYGHPFSCGPLLVPDGDDLHRGHVKLQLCVALHADHLHDLEVWRRNPVDEMGWNRIGIGRTLLPRLHQAAHHVVNFHGVLRVHGDRDRCVIQRKGRIIPHLTARRDLPGVWHEG